MTVLHIVAHCWPFAEQGHCYKLQCNIVMYMHLLQHKLLLHIVGLVTCKVFASHHCATMYWWFPLRSSQSRLQMLLSADGKKLLNLWYIPSTIQVWWESHHPLTILLPLPSSPYHPLLTLLPLPPSLTTLPYHLPLPSSPYHPLLTLLPYHPLLTLLPLPPPLPPPLATLPYHPPLPPSLTTSPYHLPYHPPLTTLPYHPPLPPSLTTSPYPPPLTTLSLPFSPYHLPYHLPLPPSLTTLPSCISPYHTPRHLPSCYLVFVISL